MHVFPFTVVAGVHAMDSVATLQRDVWAVRITKRLGSENSVVTCTDWSADHPCCLCVCCGR